jgi:thiamine-phosphate pyrophosphorylase
MQNKLKGLYVLTDDKLTPLSTITSQVKELLESQVKVIQFRDKIHSDSQIAPIAQELQNLCTEFEATFIINDRVDLAKKIGADGVHIGMDDTSLTKARKLLPNAIIGVSCYGDLNRAKEAQKLGASYVAFGACFSSSTKPQAKPISLEIIKKAKEEISIPICVIGGINKNNIHLVKDADLISVVSAAYKPDTIAKNISSLQRALL